MATFKANFTDAEKKVFGERLASIRLDRRMRQSELARQASLHLPKPMGRQLVSTYEEGRSIPGELNMLALEKALGVAPGTLLSRRHDGESVAPRCVAKEPEDISTEIHMEIDSRAGEIRISLKRFPLSLEDGAKITALLRDAAERRERIKEKGGKGATGEACARLV